MLSVVSGSVFGVNASLGTIVEQCLSARMRVAQSASRVEARRALSTSLAYVSTLLRRCNGSVASFVAVICYSCLNPHICLDADRHWCGTVKQFPSTRQLLRILSPGSPVYVVHVGRLTSGLAYGNHSNSFTCTDRVHDKVCADVAYRRALVFELGSAA